MAYNKKHSEIVRAYARVQAEPHEAIWNDYGAFREWSGKRWVEGAALAKVFPGLPWGPDNAEWLGGIDPDAWTVTWSRQYHRTPAPVANPCPNCRSADKCTKICPARARWWDVCFGGHRNG